MCMRRRTSARPNHALAVPLTNVNCLVKQEFNTRLELMAQNWVVRRTNLFDRQHLLGSRISHVDAWFVVVVGHSWSMLRMQPLTFRSGHMKVSLKTASSSSITSPMTPCWAVLENMLRMHSLKASCLPQKLLIS